MDIETLNLYIKLVKMSMLYLPIGIFIISLIWIYKAIN